MANPIGELLVREGFISSAQLMEAKAIQKNTGSRLEENLITLGFLEAEQLNQFLHPVPPVPLKLKSAGLSESFLTNLLLKAAYHEAGSFTLNGMAKTLCLPFSVIDELIELLKGDHLITIRSASGYGRETQIFELTQRGRERAEAAFQISLYVGAAPVPLQDYTRILAQQYVQQIEIDQNWIDDALKHMVVNRDLQNRLGPAFSSGRAIFLYGPPGTGKSSFAEALGRALPGNIYIPHAVEAGGQIIRLYDPAVHFSAEESINETRQLDITANILHDPRWKKCRRPVVMVGGEFTLDMLDLRFDFNHKFYEAPIQMKAANGVFILDDFGRQKVSPKEMLNRWIVPLERGTDFLSLHTGMKFEIPFDQISVFCTNLRPAELLDEAFLRRIRHKVKVPYLTEAEFKEVFRRICAYENISFNDAAIEYLLNNYYRGKDRGLTGSHCRDLIDQIKDLSRYHKHQPMLTQETINAAATNYFVEV
jgi:predicted ATPase with chaperone activity